MQRHCGIEALKRRLFDLAAMPSWARERFSRRLFRKVFLDEGSQPLLGGTLAGLAIADRLARASPGNAGWQRDLALSFAKLAEVYRGSNDLNKAMQALRQGKAIVERLTKLSPGNTDWQRDLTWFDNQITQLQASAKN